MSSRCCLTLRCTALLAVLYCQVAHAEVPNSPADERSSVVYVAVQQAQLHSGPSEDFYPTNYVPRGTMLEVYHRTKDDWLGVRPPEGSFSWVAATDAYLLPGGRMIEITTDSAVSWIGTDLGSAKQYRWQVQLDRGEQLVVLGEKSTRDANDREMLWYKIAAPSGEFRWIQKQVVSSQPQPAETSIADTPTAEMQTGHASSIDADDHDDAPKAATLAASSAGITVPGAAARASTTAHTKQAASDDGKVMAATYSAFEDDVFGATPEEIYYDDQPMPQEFVETGEWAPAHSGRKDLFDGWHAWELDDDGFRFTLLDKLLGHRRQHPTHDPLAADPFDLTMATTGPVVKQFPQPAPEPMIIAEPQRTRGYYPWRDPRTLREHRNSGFAPSASRSTANVERPVRDEAFDRSYAGAERSSAESFSANPARLTSTPLEKLAGRIEATLASTSIMKPTGGLEQSKWYGVTPKEDTVLTGEVVSRETSSPSLLAPGTATHELNQLQVMLSEMVAGPMQTWSLQNIYDQAQDLVERGATAIERGQARLLVERIEEFADLAQKQGFVALNPAVSRSSGSVVTASGVSTAPGASSAVFRHSDSASRVNGTPNYDATGWLVPVLAASAGQPAHAITDENGAILAYVSALPGMKLDHYLNQPVGIIGLRGYLPQLQAGHIQAQRVVRLQ